MYVRRLRNVPYSTPGAPVIAENVLCSMGFAEHMAISSRLPYGGRVIVTGICVVCGQFPVMARRHTSFVSYTERSRCCGKLE